MNFPDFFYGILTFGLICSDFFSSVDAYVDCYGAISIAYELFLSLDFAMDSVSAASALLTI